MHLDGDEAGRLHDDHGQRDEGRDDAAGAVRSGAGEQSLIQTRTTAYRANQNSAPTRTTPRGANQNSMAIRTTVATNPG